MEDLIDPSTGTKLTPSYQGKECLGNGSWPGYECCCDECDFFLTCFPDFNDPNHEYTYGDKRDFWRPDVREETCHSCKHLDKESQYQKRAYCLATKRWGRDLRAHRCPHFEFDSEAHEKWLQLGIERLEQLPCRRTQKEDYRTERQWRQEKRAILPDVEGHPMHSVNYKSPVFIYYLFEETYPLSD